MISVSHSDIDENTTRIEIDGPVNSVTGSEIDEYVTGLVDDGRKYLLVDASGIEFLSSEGIGLFLMLNDRLKKVNGAVVFYNMIPEVYSLFNALGFDSVLPMADNRSGAEELLTKIKRGDYVQRERFEPDAPPQPEVDVTMVKTRDEMPDGKTADKYIVECPQCGSLMRIEGGGEYICPECSVEIRVSDNLEIEKMDKTVQPGKNPVIAECPGCNTLIRITGPGDYLCPGCTRKFQVLDDYSIKF